MAKIDDLSRLDPAASSSYSMYKAAQKDGEGSFIDFLLKYDSNKANKGDFSSILGDDENGKAISSLIKDTGVSADTLTQAIKGVGKSDKNNSSDMLSNLLNAKVGSNYDLLSAQANEAIAKALNSKALTDEQKQLIASKYAEFNKEA